MMYTELDQSPCDSVSQIDFWHLRCLAGVPSQWCNSHTYIQQKSQSGDFPRKLRHVTTRTDDVFCKKNYLVKMYAAQVQCPCSLMASPPYSAVCATIAQRSCLPSIHSTDHYIIIGHPVVTLTTIQTCCLSPRQYSPKNRPFGVPLGCFHGNSYL